MKPGDTAEAEPKAKPATGNPLRRCVFCMKTTREVLKMVESGVTGARICDECVGDHRREPRG